MKGVLCLTGLGKVLQPQLDNVNDDDWKEMQEQVVSTPMLYLQSQVIKQLEEYIDCKSLFEALQQKYN